MLRALLSLATIGVTLAKTVNFDLTVGNSFLSPDGFNRSTVVAGLTPNTLQFPGPLLTANKGDIINIKVTNRLNDPNMRRSTSLVFGNFFQQGHPEFDGQSFATQCPIAPGHSFTYTINATSQAGTWLYRSGLSNQYADGLRGPLIIYDPNDPHKDLYDVDDATTIFQLGEWYDRPAPAIQSQFVVTASIPIYDAGTINGVGRTNTNPHVPFSVFTVEQGKRYRFRLISNAPRAVMPFVVDQHNLTVIEADGVSTQPVEVEGLELYPGQRYSVVFTANQPVGNYWLRSYLRGGTQTRNSNLNATFNQAIIRYKGAPATNPTTPQVNVTFLAESQLHPVVNPGSPGGADAKPDLDLLLNFTTFPTADNPLDTWRVNGIVYEPPTIPTLVQILQNNDSFPASSHVIQVPPNALIQMVMPLGDDEGGHPIHVHGVNFDVIKPGTSNDTNFVNPSRRDVIPVITNTTIVRFRGPAFGVMHVHCHIIWHAEAGLQFTFITPPNGIRQNVHPPSDWQQLCAAYNALPADQK